MSAPTPRLDPPPEDGPGGADAVDEYVEEFPHLTPDPPVSAQMDEDVVPDEIQQPEDKQQEGDRANGGGAGTEEPA